MRLSWRSLLAAAPVARRIWRWLPGPLKVGAVVGGLVAAYRRRTRPDERDEPGDSGST